MTLVAFSPARLESQEELRPFERFLRDVSSSFSRLEPRGVADAVAEALAGIGGWFGVDDATLVMFDEAAAPTVLSAWASAPHSPCRTEELARMPWLLERLAHNDVVAVATDADLPVAAREDRAYAERTGARGRLAVPIALGGRVAYGLIVGRRQRVGDWRTPLIDRLRLAAEVIGSHLQRLDGVRRPPAPPDRPVDTAAEMAYFREEARNQIEADEMIGDGAALRVARERLEQVAPLDATVLLLGETGTGKELFARALHERSSRRARTLICVNCAALPPSLIESELFGHERGAFTGALAARDGRFELAHLGTIFLDEIGDLAPELQAKLLRVLQEGEFERVGSSKSRRVDVRVIAATHVDLEAAVAAGRFRADLYYRLSVFPIWMPPLRDRREDIPQLVWFFIHRRQRELRRRIARVPAPVMQALQQHDWPGNVRELRNVVERAMIRSTDGTLRLDDPLCVARHAPNEWSAGESLDAVQRRHIEGVLRECGGRINGPGNAAVRLGIHPNTLRFRIKKLGVVTPGRQR